MIEISKRLRVPQTFVTTVAVTLKQIFAIRAI